MVSTTASYLAISNNLTRAQATTAAQPQVKSDTAYYLANIGNVKSIGDLVSNYRLFSYAMNAYGLGDMTYAKGLMTKVLEGGVTSSSALANTLSDPRYKAFATAFDFAGQGTNATQTTAATTGTVSNYVEQTLETTQGNANQGVQLALYFSRNASSVTSAYGLLADSNLLKVVQTAYGIQPSTSEDIDTEATQLSKVVNIADLQNPAKVQQLTERFTAMWDVDGNNTSSASSNVSTLFGNTSTGISANLLLSLQDLPLGGV